MPGSTSDEITLTNYLSDKPELKQAFEQVSPTNIEAYDEYSVHMMTLTTVHAIVKDNDTDFLREYAYKFFSMLEDNSKVTNLDATIFRALVLLKAQHQRLYILQTSKDEVLKEVKPDFDYLGDLECKSETELVCTVDSLLACIIYICSCWIMWEDVDVGIKEQSNDQFEWQLVNSQMWESDSQFSLFLMSQLKDDLKELRNKEEITYH
ncbi:hypothetical protein [Spongorhabdus nitratireducens]